MKKIPDEMTSEQLVADFKTVVADAEALLKATANQGDEKLDEIRSKVEESLKAAKNRLGEAQEELLLNTMAAARATDVYVHKNPWESMGVAAGIGLLVGLLLCRR